MRKIDAFAHILPRSYLERLERQLEKTMAPHRLDYYRQGVFSFDPVLTDLDARWRKIEPYGDYAQVLVLAVPPLEEVGPPEVSAEFARIANDELAELVQRFGTAHRIRGRVAALGRRACLARARPRPDSARRAGRTAVYQRPGCGARRSALRTRCSPGSRMPVAPCGFTQRAARRRADYPTESRSDFGLWWSLGWPYETAAALSRLVYSGHMERHPRQLVIAHHGGGMVPHFSARLAMGPGYRQVKDRLPRPPLDYFRRFHVDTALFGAPHAVRCVLEFFGPRHVLFGTDMPLGPSNSVEATIADIDSAGLSREDMAAVYSGNAVRLLGLEVG